MNISYGHNEELLNKCKPLKDYSIFTTKVKEYRRTGLSLEDAIDKAIDECIEEGVLMDILFKHRTLAKNTILTEYNEKKRRKLDRQEGFEDGLACGMERGIGHGIEAFILDNLEEGVPEERIIDKLIIRFQLDNEKAQDYVQKYK